MSLQTLFLSVAAAAWFLAGMTPEPAPAAGSGDFQGKESPRIGGCIHDLKNKDPLVRRQAARALAKLGPRAGRAIPALREALSDADEGVRTAAVAAIDEIARGTPSAGGEDESADLKDRYEQTLKSHREETAALNAAAARQVEEIRQSTEAALKKSNDELLSMSRELEQLRGENARMRKDVEAERFRARTALLDAETATAESQRRQAEAEQLRKTLAEREARLLDLQKELKVAKDQVIATAVAAETARRLKDHDQGLLAGQEGLARERDGELRKRNAPRAEARTAGVNPPAHDIRGLVSDVDAASGLVTVSVGSEQGVEKGQTLEVFRFKPRPEYVGMIRIIDVRLHDADGKLAARRGPASVQKGDRVASELAPSP